MPFRHPDTPTMFAMKVPLGLQLRAIVMLASARVLLKTKGTTETLRRLAAARRTSRAADPAVATRAVHRAGRLVGGLCLPQCVALTALLQREGRSPTLVLGCRRTAEGSWTAHAWVELEHDVLEPVKGGRNAPLAQLRHANGWTPSAVDQDRF